MLHKSRGVVLHMIKYRDSSIITRIFTEEFGLQSYIVNGVRSSKGKNKISLFQPLTLLDLVVYHHPEKDINRISEIKCTHPYHSIPYNIKKSGIALFLAEFLNKCLREEGQSVEMFAFIHDSLRIFDNIPDNFNNCHLQILLQLSRYLGFDPVHSGEIYEQILLHTPDKNLADRERDAIDGMLNNSIGTYIKIGNNFRRDLLQVILDFYRLHIENLGALKSIDVLREVLN